MKFIFVWRQQELKKRYGKKNSVGYENKTLKQIAKEIADKLGYTLIGEISDIRVDRITQNKERDLTFLTKLAEQYGSIFKIAENNLVSMICKVLKVQNPRKITDELIKRIGNWINNRSMKILGWKSPDEIFKTVAL